MVGALLACATDRPVNFELDIQSGADESSLGLAIADLAARVLDADTATGLDASDRAWLEVAAGRYPQAVGTIEALRASLDANGRVTEAERWAPLEVYARALDLTERSGIPFEEAYREAFRSTVAALDGVSAERVSFWFVANLDAAREDLDEGLARHAADRSLKLQRAVELVRRHQFWETYRRGIPLSDVLIAADREARYWVDDSVLIDAPGGYTLSAVVVRPRNASGPLPTALNLTAYTNLERHLEKARMAAAHGYVGVVADVRGKRLSRAEFVPYEVEGDDAHAVIDWIVRQPWSDGDVGMYGGSYEGFTAWAAAKRGHPALRTIAAYVAAIPGFGLPMENNVFLNANYAWPFYVANTRYLDDETYFDRGRWQALNRDWYASGRPYREIDRIDGTPNPYLQRWLDHPAYDAYWQSMVPYREEYADIDIPVLTVTGYYDDGQISAVHYLREHYTWNEDADHYLVIGPYDHFGAQGRVKPVELRGYAIDPVAQIDTEDLTFQWLDHVLRGAERPELLSDRINYQVMGADVWRHAPSIDAMSDTTWTLYLSDVAEAGRYLLAEEPPATPATFEQVVDFADRTTMRHSYYPSPIVRDSLEVDTGIAFITPPLMAPVEVSGSFSGVLHATIDRRDFDFQVVLYEVMPDDRVMQLSYYLGRASYAEDMTSRQLLSPGVVETIPFERTRLVSRRLSAGSRLLVVIDVVKDSFHQINYGTGGEVSDESMAEAVRSLTVRWGAGSFIRIPVRR